MGSPYTISLEPNQPGATAVKPRFSRRSTFSRRHHQHSVHRPGEWFSDQAKASRCILARMFFSRALWMSMSFETHHSITGNCLSPAAEARAESGGVFAPMHLSGLISLSVFHEFSVALTLGKCAASPFGVFCTSVWPRHTSKLSSRLPVPQQMGSQPRSTFTRSPFGEPL